jgi:hypothetical protein
MWPPATTGAQRTSRHPSTTCQIACFRGSLAVDYEPTLDNGRALATGNLHLIRAAAAELPRVDLGDALVVCMAIREADRSALSAPPCAGWRATRPSVPRASPTSERQRTRSP